MTEGRHCAARDARPPYRKILYLRQAYPDNWVDSSFLKDLQRNGKHRESSHVSQADSLKRSRPSTNCSSQRSSGLASLAPSPNSPHHPTPRVHVHLRLDLRSTRSRHPATRDAPLVLSRPRHRLQNLVRPDRRIRLERPRFEHSDSARAPLRVAPLVASPQDADEVDDVGFDLGVEWSSVHRQPRLWRLSRDPDNVLPATPFGIAAFDTSFLVPSTLGRWCSNDDARPGRTSSRTPFNPVAHGSSFGEHRARVSTRLEPGRVLSPLVLDLVLRPVPPLAVVAHVETDPRPDVAPRHGRTRQPEESRIWQHGGRGGTLVWIERGRASCEGMVDDPVQGPDQGTLGPGSASSRAYRLVNGACNDLATSKSHHSHCELIIKIMVGTTCSISRASP